MDSALTNLLIYVRIQGKFNLLIYHLIIYVLSKKNTFWQNVSVYYYWHYSKHVPIACIIVQNGMYIVSTRNWLNPMCSLCTLKVLP